MIPMKRRRLSLLLLAGFLCVVRCSYHSEPSTSAVQSYDELPFGMSDSDTFSSTVSDMTHESSTDVDSKNFSLTDVDGYPVLDGRISDLIGVHAKIVCDRDLENPGSASIDVAIPDLYVPADVDSFYEPDGEVLDDYTKLFRNSWGMWTDFRYSEYKNSEDRILSFRCLSSAFSITTSEGLTFYGVIPDRIPWDSDSYPWGAEEFSFTTHEEAFADLQSYAERLSIVVSPEYDIYNITPEFFSLLSRLESGLLDTPLPQKTWTDEDSLYRISASLDWNSLPISNSMLNPVLYEMPDSGQSYHGVNPVWIDYFANAEGVQFFYASSGFSLNEKGEELPLVSMYTALGSLQEHFKATQDIEAYPHQFENTNASIDLIKLCYLPLYKDPINPADSQIESAAESDTPPDSVAELIHVMVPCWTFRMVYSNPFSGVSVLNFTVDATTGEYLPSYSEKPITEYVE